MPEANRDVVRLCVWMAQLKTNRSVVDRARLRDFAERGRRNHFCLPEVVNHAKELSLHLKKWRGDFSQKSTDGRDLTAADQWITKGGTTCLGR